MDLRSDLTGACNARNLDHRRPKAYGAAKGDGTIRLCGEEFVYVGRGCTDDQLATNILVFLQASDGMREFMEECFAQLASKDPPTNDAAGH